jgi:acetyltransferase
MPVEKLRKVLNPEVIAVIGATTNKKSVGYAVLQNLVGGDFDGTVYPVNPTRRSVLGVKAYPSVLEIPDKVDLALIATPASTVPEIVVQCGQAGVSGVVVLSAGFKEAGKEGEARCEQMLKSAREYGVRIIGPNCLGFMRPSRHLNATFARNLALPGGTAFISQSGALGTAMLDWAVRQKVGFSYFVSIGSSIDVDFDDLIDFFGQDPETTSIVIYMESLTDARRFLSAARAFSRTKPIIVLKAGRSAEGAQAALSHTGSLAGNDAVYDAAFKRAGAVRVSHMSDLFNVAQTLSLAKRPTGNRLAIVTNAGGPGVVATDALVELGGELAKLSTVTMEKLNAFLPKAWSKSNPVDVLGDADAERYKQAVELCLEDRGVDGVLVILTPQAMTDSTKIAEEIVALPHLNRKTVLASWMGEDSVREGAEVLKRRRIPVYSVPESAVESFMSLHHYARNLELLYETPATTPHAFAPKTEENRKLIATATREGRSVLNDQEVRQLLANYDIPVLQGRLAKSPGEAASLAAEVGFPIVMKIASPDILHKTEAKGVRMGVQSGEEASRVFTEMVRAAKRHLPSARIDGVSIEETVAKRYELLIGCKKDPIFGPAIVFGMGGVAVEVFRDTNVGLPPLNMALSMRLMEGTKVYRLLKGYRGMRGVDVESIQFLLYKFAYLVADFPEISEIDINPFAVDEKGGVVLDAKVILDESLVGKRVRPYSHLVISPYPSQYITQYTMTDGTEVTLRPIRPEDEPMEAEMFTRFSMQTQKFRFFQLIKDISHEMLVRYTQIDYDREIAIIAELDEGKQKKMLGVARLIADPDRETAEFAIVVADPWQHKGLGSKLTDYLLEIARGWELGVVYARFLKENVIMKQILLERGFVIKDTDEDSYHAELELNGRAQEGGIAAQPGAIA